MLLKTQGVQISSIFVFSLRFFVFSRTGASPAIKLLLIKLLLISKQALFLF